MDAEATLLLRFADRVEASASLGPKAPEPPEHWLMRVLRWVEIADAVREVLERWNVFGRTKATPAEVSR